MIGPPSDEAPPAQAAAEADPPAPPRGRRRRQALIGGTTALVIGGFVALLVMGLVASRTSTALDDAIREGRPRPAPDFSLPILVNGAALGRRDGEPLALSELRGRPVVVNFWASWCVPCKREAPRLEAAWQRHRRGGLVMLGVDVKDLTQDALAFVRRYGQKYPSVRDKSDDASEAYGLTGVPETFFVDRQGRVVAHVLGEISSRQLEDGIGFITARRRN